MTATRDRIVQAGATLMWQQGYPATGMKQIVALADAPFGSVYHFFPGGKEELGAEAVRWAGAVYGDLVDVLFAASTDDLPTTLRSVFAAAGQNMVDSDYADACPVATVALEMSSVSEPIRLACAETFEQWTTRLTSRFFDLGVPADRAPELSTTFLMLLEGAFLLARAHRSVEPLRVAGEAMVLAASHVLEAATERPGPVERGR